MKAADRELIELAVRASEKAYAPYSGYKVGAALKSRDSAVFTGANIENASYGSSICAERAAMINAVNNGVTKFEKIAIYSKDFQPFPCGNCLQTLSEFFEGEESVIITDNKEITIFKFSELFPHPFKLENERI